MDCVRVSPASAIPLSLSSLVCLEKLTISADLVFHCRSGYSNGPGFISSIYAISQLLKTALFLQHLTLDFHFHINGLLQLPHDTKALWYPLVSLISQSSSSCINLRVKATKLPGFTAISPEIVTSSLASCPALTQMVQRGLLVIIPVMPDPPVPEVKEPSDKSIVTPPTSSGNINDRKQRKWLANLWPFGKPGEG